MTLRIARVTGHALTHHLDEVARLRIQVFREFPYLYDGTMDYERRYLRTYIDAPDSVVVLAWAGDQVIGAATAVPLRHAAGETKKSFLEQGYDVEKVFYCGESVVAKAYRGLGVRFFQEREAHARALGGFGWSCFCAVQRQPEHPRRPPGYQPLNAFWHQRGYRQYPELRTIFHWRDLDESEESAKPMVFWLKRLAG